MTEIIISEFMDEAAVADLARDHTVTYDPDLVDDRPGMLAALSDARGIVVRNRTQVDQEVLDAAPGLKVVGRLGVGLDNIDLDACAARGVTVCPATGANDDSVAEYVIAAALVLVRGSYMAREAMLAGSWPRQALIGGEVGGRTMGLVGFGGISRQVARRAAALNMTVLAHDPFVDDDDPAWMMAERTDFDDLIARSDVVSLHVPLTDGTRDLIGGSVLDRMKAGAVLINTARGGVVDENALAEALRAGRLGGAALDVFAQEPLGADGARVFEGLDNVILTPHIGGVTGESNVRVSGVTADNVRRVLAES